MSANANKDIFSTNIKNSSFFLLHFLSNLENFYGVIVCAIHIFPLLYILMEEIEFTCNTVDAHL